MPTIYRTQKMTRSQRCIILLVAASVVANFGLRLFHLRLGLIPFEQQLQAELRLPEADLHWFLSWFEFGLILALSYVIIILMFISLLLREVVWRLWVRPSVRLMSAKAFMLIGIFVVAAAFSVFLFFSPEAAKGTGADAGPIFTGTMNSVGVIMSFVVVFKCMLRPQEVDYIFRVHWGNRV